MKPVTIELSAFGSFGAVEKISFENTTQGIFLITGDTGAGKTTIFDAITYALYGRTSGGKRDGSMMRSQFAPENQLTYVSYTFSSRGDLYTVYRQPDQLRPSRRKNKDGIYELIKETKLVRLTLPNGKAFTGSAKETDAKICEIIGMDVGQFTQIAMIAQGDFVRLLHAPSKERRAIFAKLFDTRLCEAVQITLEARRKTLYGRLMDNKKLAEHDLEGIRLAKGSRYEEQWAHSRLSENDNAKLLNLLEDVQQELFGYEETYMQQQERLAQELHELAARLATVQETNQLLERYEKAKQAFAEYEDGRGQEQELEEKIRCGRRAQAVHETEIKKNEKFHDLEKMQEKLQNLENKITESQAEIQSQTKRYEQAAEAARGKKPLEEELLLLERAFETYETYAKTAVKLEQEQAQVCRLQQEQEAYEKACQKTAEQQEEASRLLESLGDCERQLYECRKKQDVAERRLGYLNEIMAKEARIEAQETSKRQKQEAFAASLKQYQQKAAEHERLYGQFLASQAGVMAGELAEGQPCPVCGSTEHPHLARSGHDAVSQSMVETAKERKEQADQTLQAAKEEAQSAAHKLEQEYVLLQQVLSRLEADMGTGFSMEPGGWSKEDFGLFQKEQENMQKACEAAKTATCAAQKNCARYAEEKARLDALRKDAVQLEQKRQKAKEACTQARLLASQLEKECEMLSEQLPFPQKKQAQARADKLRAKIDELEQNCQKAQARLQTLREQADCLKGEQISCAKQAKQCSKEAGALEAEYVSVLRQQQFADEAQYKLCKPMAAAIQENEAKLNAYRIGYASAKAALNELQVQAEGKEPEAAQPLAERMEQLKQEQEAFAKKIKQVYSLRSGNAEHIQSLKAFFEERRGLEKRYQVLHDLYETACGRLSGSAHLNFQTYMQRRYFVRVIQEANKRLRIMSRGQFELRCRSVEDLSHQAEAGLDLDVCSIVSGQTRDVKTLSGGESFMAALAMALGLADIIQNAAGSVRLDTMFIDEGFGSLDEDSRREAIRILGELAGGSRLIGIISHVTELREQIPVRLHVHKNERGSHADWLSLG